MPAPVGPLSVQDVYGEQNALSGDILKFLERNTSQRTEQYNAATEELKKRRFGPSQAEQLFALAAAIGKPTYDRSFGSIMANVAPAMGQIAQARRTADEERSAAAQALREKYLGAQQETELATLQERRKALADKMELAKALAKPPTSDWSSTSTGVVFNQRTGFPKPQAAHVNALLANPSKTREFDIKFGPGAAEEVLRMYGQKGV